MKVAVLPFNVTEGTKPVLGRQIAGVAAETLRSSTEADVHSVSYLAQIQEEGGNRTAHVNMGTAVLEHEFFLPLFKDAQAEKVMHGLLTEQEGNFKLEVRIESKGEEQSVLAETHDFSTDEVFSEIHRLIGILADQAGVELPSQLKESLDLGTKSGKAFLLFLEGYDSIQYIQQANGAVTRDFQPTDALRALVEACKADPQFRAPFDTCIQLCRTCAQHRIGRFEEVEAALKELQDLAPNDYRATASLGEIHQAVGDFAGAADFYEQAIQAHLALGAELAEGQKTERGALYSRLGLTQLNMGMPVNAERNFRRAIELEGEDKPTLDLLANVLAQTNRQHDIPNLWKDEIARNQQNARAWARYAAALMQLGQKDEAIRIFEDSLVQLDDSTTVKRFYAPLLSQLGDLDRSMDFYEDCLDAAPNDIQLMIEYANTLKAADREFEIPQVLRNVLASNPDPDTRAQTQAWLIELEQAKRAEAVEEARQKLEAGDADAAVRILKPLRNWLSDYWKIWAILGAAYNRLEMPKEAEEAATRLVNIYPGYELAYAELVQALTAQDRHEEAYNVMRHAASNVGSLGVHVNLALAAKRAGHMEEARNIARQIREVVGPNEELEPVLAEIEA